jgi:membrane-associated phospholipid phosphatase
MKESTRKIIFNPIVFIIFSLVLVTALLFLFHRFSFFPKILIFALIVLSVLFFGKFRVFVRDWSIFIALVYFFDSLRGAIFLLICKFHFPVYTLYVIILETSLFGKIPSIFLQNRLLSSTNPAEFTWLEKAATIIYGSHFVAFIFIGFLIWLYKPRWFKLYKTSFYLAMGIGLLCYLLVPTVPPWIAANQFKLLPPITHFNLILFNFVIPNLSNGLDINPVAAMPSLHATFPILCSLLLWNIYRLKSVPFIIYTLSVLFTIIYSGDHYVIDILAGFILAIICFLTARKLNNIQNHSPETENIFRKITEHIPGDLRCSVEIGVTLLLIGFFIGSLNKSQFMKASPSWGKHAPTYIEFIQDPVRYKNQYQIQYYLGKHYFIKEQYGKALSYFLRCSEISHDATQVNVANQNINICNRMLVADSNWRNEEFSIFSGIISKLGF